MTERNPLSTPIRGDRFAGNGRLYAVDELRREGVVLEIDGGADRVVWSWNDWPSKAAGFAYTHLAVDPCRSTHLGKIDLVRNLGRCYNLYRCLACGRTYEVDSSD